MPQIDDLNLATARRVTCPVGEGAANTANTQFREFVLIRKSVVKCGIVLVVM